MLLYTGLLLSALIGFSFIHLISKNFSWTEKIGFSFPVGMAIQTVAMLLLDFVGISLTATSLLLEGGLILGLINFWIYRCQGKSGFRFHKPTLSHINLIWLFFILFIAYIEYMNFVKCIYTPPFDRDSLAGFETIGYIIAQEHTFKGLSLFQGDYIQDIHSPASYITYAPMVQLCYAYVYILGAETSKIINALFFLFFLIAFYGSVQRVAGRTGAAIATFFVLLTPELLAFSSLSMTNVIHAVFASLGIIYLTVWFRDRKQKDLYLSMILLAINNWCRTEGIVFIGAALLMLFIDAIQKKQFKTLFISGTISISLILFWTLFCKINGLYAESIAITHPFWDGEKLNLIWNYMLQHYQDAGRFGVSFIVFLWAIILNIWWIIKYKDNIYLLSMIFVAMLFYIIILYQIDYKWDAIQNVMMHSAKRFMFCFIPLLWYYVITNRSSIYVLNKIENFLKLKK